MRIHRVQSSFCFAAKIKLTNTFFKINSHQMCEFAVRLEMKSLADRLWEEREEELVNEDELNFDFSFD